MATSNGSNSDHSNHSDTSKDELSSSQTEKLLQLQDLTGIEDLERCKQILASNNWNLEQAVRKFTFGENESSYSENASSEVNTPPDSPSTRSISNSNTSTSSSTAAITSAVNNRQVSLFTGIFRLLTIPFHIVYDTFLSLFRFAWSLVRSDPRRYLTDPVSDVLKFVESFEETYGRNHPVFYQGTYSQALNDAKRELKFLLVYLHSEQHQDTEDFCRSVLVHQEVVNYINRNNLLFWACSVSSPEGYRVSQALRENTYPFLALIALKDNRMTVVKKFEGKTTVERLLSQLQQAIEDNEGSLVAARYERQERNMTHIIRKQQDEAYLESLKADQEKERKKEEEKQKKDAEIRAQQEKEQNEISRRQRLLAMKQSLKREIPSEPDANNPDAIKVVIKLPNGSRLERKFLKSQPIKYLYYFVFCNEESPLSFEIVTNFPRRHLPWKSPSLPDYGSDEKLAEECPSFEAVGLGKSEMLFVNDLEA